MNIDTVIWMGPTDIFGKEIICILSGFHIKNSGIFPKLNKNPFKRSVQNYNDAYMNVKYTYSFFMVFRNDFYAKTCIFSRKFI